MRVGRSRTFVHFQSLHPAVKGHAGLGRGTWLRPCGRVAVWPQGSWAPPAPRRGCLRTSLCSPPGTSRAARSLCDPTASQFVVPVAHVLVRELRGHVRAPIGDCASRSEKRRGGGSAGGGGPGPGPGPSVGPGPAGVPSTTAQFENYICIQDNKSCIFWKSL